MNLGQRIKEIRMSKNIRANELARETGISKSAICQIEKGDKNPKMITIQKIAAALDIPLSKLYVENVENIGAVYCKDKRALELYTLYRKLTAEKKLSLLDYARYLNNA